MKKTLLASLVLAAAAVPFAAQAQQGYFGVNLGQANHSLNDAGLVATSRAEKKTAFKIYGGYNFDKNWGVEVGYADFGNPRNVYTVAGAPVTLDYRASAVYVAGTGTLPINDQFALFGKLGFSAGRVSGSVSGAGTTFTGSGSKSSVMGGIGASYSFTKNLAVVAEYEDFGKVNTDIRASMWSIGLRYKF
jgi:OOP family OmpA-OmpF porin